MAAWSSCVGDEDACWIFAVASSRPGLVGLVGLAGESRELCKWLQCCPLSSRWGLFFKINLPGVIEGGILSKRASGSTSMGGKKCQYVAVFFCLTFWGAAYQCAEAPLVSLVCVGCVYMCSAMHYLCVCIYLFSSRLVVPHPLPSQEYMPAE